MKHIFASVGELRASHLTRFHQMRSQLMILTAAPGFAQLPDVAAGLYKDPSKRLSARLGKTLRAHLLSEFSKDLDLLEKSAPKGQLLGEWAESLRTAQCNIRFFEERPLHTRLIATEDSSLIFPEPIGEHDSSDHELRLLVQGVEHERILAWFEERFKASSDISSEVLRCIQESWAGDLISPIDAYRKALASYFDEVLLSMDREYDVNPLLEHLTEFQVEAYHYAKFILRRYGGVFLADVVGLGKTYIAMALLKHLQDAYGEHPVVVAPPKVIPAWEALGREHRVELVLVSIGKLDELECYRDREVLVVDESHNFRNADTRRYEELAKWVRPAGEAATRKVLLLSATPQNNSIIDIQRQLALFPDNFGTLPIKTESLDEWCREVRAGRRTATELLQHVVVRRTRRYIKEAFPNATLKQTAADGTTIAIPLRFPLRVSGAEQCLRYSLTETYHGQLYHRILSVLAALTYPLHSLGAYISQAGLEHPSTRGIRRSGTSVRGLFKVLLLKRLESSFYAFRLSIQRLESRLSRMIHALEQGVVPVAGELDEAPDGEEEPSFLGSRALPLELFDAVRLRKSVHQDLLEVRSLLALINDLNQETDAKVRRLVEFLRNRPPREHKTIVFTQFVDTAEYLAAALRAQGLDLEVAKGGEPSAMTYARRFSPRSNRYALTNGSSELQLLVSTDVLSEGVNLQDADTLVNYDLHWNPVRLIQRAGRIDRIGSEHEEIQVASFLPERELEQGLGLEEVLRRRIREFIEVFGEDSDVLPSDSAPQEGEMMRAYSGEALAEEGDDDELDGLSRHQERLLRFREDEPEEYARILRLRPGRFSECATQTDVAASRVGGFWFFWNWTVEGVKETNARAAFDVFYANASRQSAERASARGWTKLAEIEFKFQEQARTLRAQRVAPRMSPSLLSLLESLESLQSSSTETQKDLIVETIDWVRARAGHPTVERVAYQLRKAKSLPHEALAQCRRLFGTVSAAHDELGEATLVVGSLSADPV